MQKNRKEKKGSYFQRCQQSTHSTLSSLTKNCGRLAYYS